MRRTAYLSILLLIVAISSFAQQPRHDHTGPAQISGDYVETRSADVYTGVCFANGEVNLVGDEAIMAWHVSQGSWQGENLAGLEKDKSPSLL